MFKIRAATPEDAGAILGCIRALAEYEKMGDCVTATQEDIEKTIFEGKYAEVLLAEEDGQVAGFALFCHNYSTFLAKPGIHLEDLFVYPRFRGKGYGKALIRAVAALALERGCGRLEWACLDWNAPSIAFYESLGAQALSEWTSYRLEGEALHLEQAEKIDGREG